MSWPLYWYFRDNPNASPFGGTLNANTDAAVIFILANRSGTPQNSAVLSKYTGVTYAFRWHFPEELYRNFAIAPELTPGSSAWGVQENPHGIPAIAESIWSSVMTQSDPEGAQRLFRLLMYRELPEGLNGYRYKIYIRNDLLPYYNDIRYGE